MFIEILTHAVAAVAGVLLARVFANRSDRRRKALDLYERYNSTETIGARNEAWRFLNTQYEGQPIWELYSDRETVPGDPYNALVQVSYFWYSLFVLGRERVLDRRVARELFKEQFVAWREALRPLYRATVEALGKHGRSEPWQEFRYMDEAAMSWLVD